MKILSERVELAANILIIAAAVTLVGFIAQRYLLSAQSPPQQARSQPVVGSKVNLADVDFLNNGRTLILGLQTGCRFCIESVPFYKRIVESVGNSNVKLVAVFPTSVEEGFEYLRANGLDSMEVRRSPLSAIQVYGTPTLILANEKGEVTELWVGKLTPEKEREVIDRLIPLIGAK